MSKNDVAIIAVIGIMLVSQCCASTVRLNALVVDEKTDIPVEHVSVVAYFMSDRGWSALKSSTGPNTVRATTDRWGRCKFTGESNSGKAGIYVADVLHGYYVPQHGGARRYSEKNLFGVWQPENLVVTVMLQHIEHPIPLFVKQVGERVPNNILRRVFPGRVEGEEIAFDMFKGDWLPPVGKGVVADVVFKRLPGKSLCSAEDVSGVKGVSCRHAMSVRFLGDDNGLLETGVSPNCKLWIRAAPDDGYVKEYISWWECDGSFKEKRNYDKRRCFCFRIRTRRNEKGEMIEAYYGKIYGDIGFSTQVQPEHMFVAEPCFRYYLNPTSLDRNLEWNMVNLCKDPGELNSPQP